MFILPPVFNAGDTIYFPFDTYAASGASITMSGLAVTDIEVYKNGSTTQRASDNGYALLDTDGIDFDGTTGLHGFSIDTSDNSDAGFWADGAQYWVNINAVTVDSQTVRFTYFLTLGYLLRPTTAGRTLDVSAGGEGGVDWANIGSPTTTVNLSGTTIKTATDVETDTADIQSRIPPALINDRMASDAIAISGSTAAADAVEANIGNLDDAITDVMTAIGNLNDFDPTTEAVTVEDIEAAALAKFFTEDTGETNSSAVNGSVIGETAKKVWNSSSSGWSFGTMGELFGTFITNLSSIGAQLGGWTGIGRNTIKGAFQALFRKDADATVPSDINADLGSGAGTADNTTDSAQAIRDRGDAAWITATDTAVLAAIDALNNLSSAQVVTALKADTEWKTLLANVEGCFVFTPPGSLPGTGTLVLKNKANDTTLAEFDITLDADGFATERENTGP